jgi:hypothetical protein
MGSALARHLANRYATFAIVVVLFAVQAVIRFRSHLDPDVAWYLYAGGRLLDGGVLYVDVVEVNPPLGIWLTVPIAAAARILGVGTVPLLYTVLLCLTALSLALSARLLSAAADISDFARHLILILLAALMLFLPAADFGQRDHVMIVLATPWLLLRWNRLVDQVVSLPFAALVGLMAAFGLWLKPHYVIAVFAVELVLIFGTRRLRTTFCVENLAIAVLGACYIVAAYILVSKHFVSLFVLSSQVFVPIYGGRFEEAVQNLIMPIVLGIAAVASLSLLSPSLVLLRTLFLAAGMAFLAIFLFQVGYRHQILPGLFVMAVAAGLGVARVVSCDVRPAGFGERAVVLASGAAILLAFGLVCLPQSMAYRGGPFEQAIEAEAPEAKSIFIASTAVQHPFPLVEEKGLAWASRYPAQWFAPHIAKTLGADGAPGDHLSRGALEATISDLVRFVPDILFVDVGPSRSHFSGPPLDYLAFWEKDERFRSFWEGYEKRGEVEGFSVFVRRTGERGQ